AQDPNRAYNIQPEANQSDQKLSMGLQSRELMRYATKHATVVMTGGVVPSTEQSQAVPILPNVPVQDFRLLLERPSKHAPHLLRLKLMRETESRRNGFS